MTIRAITWDFGETLTTLDASCLARKLASRGAHVDEARVLEALPAAWETYQRSHAGVGAAGQGSHPWKPLMAALLALSGATPASEHDALVDFLFEDQRRENLWRKPIAGMIELVRELAAEGVPMCVLSNSEGRLVELVAELGWSRDLPLVIDSGKVGVEKPDPAIFELAAQSLGVRPDETIHVGDSLRADVGGALGVGARALWFTPPPAYPERRPAPAPGVLVATSAFEAGRALRGVLGIAAPAAR